MEKLLKACRRKNYSLALEMLQQGADPNITDTWSGGHTALHYSCVDGNLEFVKTLVETYKCKTTMKSLGNKQTPLHYASQYGHTDIVQYLTVTGQRKCNPEVQDVDLQTPLHLACRYNHLNTVKYLVGEAGCKLEVRDKDRQTPIHIACKYGHFSIVQYLIIEQGCDLDVRDKCLKTPVYIAYVNNHMDIVNLMKEFCLDNIINRDKHTLLHLACRDGLFDLIKYLTSERGCTPDIKECNGRTPLHYACKHGWEEITQYLTKECKCKPDIQDTDCMTPLQLACQYGHVGIVHFFSIEYGSRLDLTGKWMKTTLHHACENDHLEVAQYLVSKHPSLVQATDCLQRTPLYYAYQLKAKVFQFMIRSPSCNVSNPVSSDGRNLLHYACQDGNLEVVKYLVNVRGCNLTLKDKAKHTPLEYACQYGHVNVVKYIIGTSSTKYHIIDPLHIMNCFEIVQYLIDEQHYNPKIKDAISLQSALCTSCQHGSLRMVQYLINKQGCSPNITDNYQQAPLCLAYQNGHMEIVHFLIKQEAFSPLQHLNSEKQTLLHFACQEGDLKLVKILTVQKGCNPNVRDRCLRTPFHYSCKNGHLEIVKHLLIECNSASNVQDKFKRTPLHYACQAGHFDVVRYLFTLSLAECDPEVEDNHHWTPLYYAYYNGHMSLVDFVMRRHSSSSLNRVFCSNQQTLVHCACRDGYLSIVQYLLDECQCNPHLRDRYGSTPLHLATENGHLDIVLCLVYDHHCDCDAKNNSKQTPVDLALENNDLMMVFHLIKHTNNTPDSEIIHSLLSFAGKQGHLNIVQHLITKRAYDPIIKDRLNTLLCTAFEYGHESIVHYLAYSPIIKDKHFDTLLCAACKYGHENIVHYLAYSPIIKDKYLDTLLCAACKYGYESIVRYLVNDLGCNTDIEPKFQSIPIYLAYQYGHKDIVKFLIGLPSSKPNSPCKYDLQKLLNSACYSGDIELTNFLINDRGCNPKMTLHHASMSGQTEIVQYLIDKHSCNPNVRDDVGQTPLHLASENGHTEIVQYLIDKHSCNPNVRDDFGQTPLHLACQRYQLDTVKCLLENEACNPNLMNKYKETPLQLTSNLNILRELIQHGADPSNLCSYQQSLLRSLQSQVKVFIVGNSSAGKSTLTAALQKESSLLDHKFTLREKVSEVDERTAGVIPYDFESKILGNITFYDFAGQPEYYGIHAALLQNAVQLSPPIFLLVVNLKDSDTKINQTIIYWLSFLENQCTSVSNSPHVVIVGSHLDTLNTNKALELKIKHMKSILNSMDFPSLSLRELIPLNCQYSQSAGMTELRKCLKKSCDDLRNYKSISRSADMCLIFLLDEFHNSTAVTLQEVQERMNVVSKLARYAQNGPTHVKPLGMSRLSMICDELGDRGHILYVKDTKAVEKSWVIIDKTALLSKVTGTIFAPEGFKEHCNLASSTGVVPLSKIAFTFPKHNLEMLVSFLSHLEFCHEISDSETYQLVKGHHQMSTGNNEDSNDRYFLFPALISVDVPEIVWDSRHQFSHHFGWMLKCSQPLQFFTSRFLQVLLLRLAFLFAFPHKQADETLIPAFQRKCSLWKNGLYWGNRDGVETLVEIVEQSKAVIVLMRCQELVSKYFSLRSCIIHRVLCAASEFCKKVNTIEFFIDPLDATHYPLKPISQLTCFSISEIAEAIVGAKSSVVSSTGPSLSLESLLKYEPYVNIGERILGQLFDPETCTNEVTTRFLSQLAERVSKKKEIIIDLFEPNQTLLAERISRAPMMSSIYETLQVFLIWKDGCEGTYLCLRKKLNKFSIFATRNPLELAGVKHQSHQQSVENTQPDTHVNRKFPYNNVKELTKILWSVHEKWYVLGKELGIPPATLEKIEKDNKGFIDDCFPALVKECVSRSIFKTNTSLSNSIPRYLIDVLRSPSVNCAELAETLYIKYVMVPQLEED